MATEPNDDRTSENGHGARERNSAFIVEACSHRGIRGDHALQRLDLGSFCFLDQKILYIEIPKAACTTIKRTLFDLLGHAEDVTPPLYSRESTLDMLIHQRQYFPCPTLLDVEHQDMRRAIGHENDWLVFAVVRSPFSRIVSFFNDKVRKGEPGYRQWHGRYIRSFSEEAAVDGFRRFVADLNPTHVSLGRNPHLVRQADLLLLGLINYSRIVKMEEMGDIFEVICERFSKAARGPRHCNRSSSDNWKKFYDEETADKIAELYLGDFATFGYSVKDWEVTTAFVEKENAASELLMKQIYERNRMIDHLYDLLFAARG